MLFFIWNLAHGLVPEVLYFCASNYQILVQYLGDYPAATGHNFSKRGSGNPKPHLPCRVYFFVEKFTNNKTSFGHIALVQTQHNMSKYFEVLVICQGLMVSSVNTTSLPPFNKTNYVIKIN